MAAGKGRLNFVISGGNDTKLESYCERTSRNEADVIRQLVSEWVEGDRKLKTPAKNHPTGKRTNIPLGYGTLAAIDEKVRVEKHATTAAVIDALLSDFLANRASDSTEEKVTVHVALPVSVYTLLQAQCEREKTTIEIRLANEAGIIASTARGSRTAAKTKGGK